MKRISATTISTLKKVRILIAEDDFIVANDLAEFFDLAGATVIGPFPTLLKAMANAAYADAAVLDVNLRGQAVFPLAELFKGAGVPFVLFTGYGFDAIPGRFATVNKLAKPSPLARADVAQWLPYLRIAARLLCLEAEQADTLVERTLETAVAEFLSKPADMTVVQWLVQTMTKLSEEEAVPARLELHPKRHLMP